MTRPRRKLRRWALILVGIVAGLAAGWMAGRLAGTRAASLSTDHSCTCDRCDGDQSGVCCSPEAAPATAEPCRCQPLDEESP
ncbi:MAG: hypothetical protein JXL80_13695 [Planctomycetes bacterium]|nr:hypothetical protein [Planctomycetota bacterium]